MRQQKARNTRALSGSVEVHLFGTPFDWSLRLIRKRTDKLCEQAEATLEKITRIAQSLGIRRILAPSPGEFNAKICTIDDLSHTVKRNGVSILMGHDADGVVLTQSTEDAFIVSSADCPTIVMLNHMTRKIICAHAGYRSLVPTESTGSVIANMHKNIQHHPDCDLQDVQVHVVLGIRDGFRHPVSNLKKAIADKKLLPAEIRKRNAMAEYARVNLTKIVSRQCQTFGIKPENIHFDEHDTLTDIVSLRSEHHRWHSHERYKREGTDRLRRNLVLIKRTW